MSDDDGTPELIPIVEFTWRCDVCGTVWQDVESGLDITMEIPACPHACPGMARVKRVRSVFGPRERV